MPSVQGPGEDAAEGLKQEVTQRTCHNPNLRDFFESGFYDAYWDDEKPDTDREQASQVLKLLGARDAPPLGL